MKRTFAIFAALYSCAAFADVKPAAIFTDNMIFQADMPMRVWGSADPGEKVKVSFMGKSAHASAGKDGYWRADLPPSKYVRKGGELLIEGKNRVAIKNVVVGEVWLCSGQSNMEYSLSSAKGGREIVNSAEKPLVRFINIPLNTAEKPLGMHGVDSSVSWAEATSEYRKQLERASAVGMLFAFEIYEKLGVPVGILNSSYGGSRLESWMTRGAAEKSGEMPYVERMEKLFNQWQERDIAEWEKMTDDERRQKGRIKKPNNRNGVVQWCYNAMINPLEPFAVRGELWYQGEMNSGTAKEYLALFPKYAEMMREKFENPRMLIFSVQLPDFKEKGWIALRDVQRRLGEAVPLSGCAVIIDGNEIDLHPKDKDAVAHRLALLALSDAYGMKVDSRSPVPAKVSLSGGAVRVDFKYAANGLKTSDSKPPRTFEAAGADGKFYPAEARIQGKSSVVLALPPEVKNPAKVRYGWSEDPDVNLYSGAGLPASPFEEDVSK